ncbi:MAG: hypothetical protein GY696_26085, partial [Gammaproteobacteria bacterium]|nr:hypothetical protein [Gammaproteobacteria bacterium]
AIKLTNQKTFTFPDGGNIRDLLEATRTGLASRYVRKELIHESHTFRTFEELQDSTLTHISTQRSAILEGLASDTSMDGPAASNPYAQAQKNMVAQTSGTHSVQPAVVATHWPLPGPTRAQGQWGAPAPTRTPTQLVARQALHSSSHACSNFSVL